MALHTPLTLKIRMSIPQPGHKLFSFSHSLDIRGSSDIEVQPVGEG